MKRGRQLFCIVLSLYLLCFSVVGSLAADAKESAYTYTVRFFSGQQGTIDGQEMVVLENLHYGDQITFNRNSVSLYNGSKYYFKGIRRSGEDNNTVGTLTFTVTEDQDYVVAYGILGNSAAYTVNYVDEAGNSLAPSETYYGNVGDKPVVAYLYIDGYRPQAYNLTRTLSANAADNEFTFVYAALPVGEGEAAPGQETPESSGAPDEAVAVIPAEEVPGAQEGEEEEEEGQDIDDEEVPLSNRGPKQVMNLDDEKVPLAAFFFDSNAKLLGIPVPVVLISGGILAGGLLWYLLLFRRRKKKERIS
ncbi:MAG: hypothetical protein HFI63_07630 [Lachnospiraceae bacterium]|nr:hypothetical protein [Lachnospiraceae bacterium]